MEKKRINWIDMAKGYGILAVFIGHMVQSSALGLFVYSFHLPLFFFLSGYLFKADDGFGSFIKKKSRSILLPYFTLGLPVVFCDAFYPLLFSGQHFTMEHLMYELSKEFMQFLFQCRYATLWYLAVLFGVNILMYFICKIKSTIIQIVIVIAAFTASMIYYAMGGTELPWNVDVAFPALIFFAFGYLTKGSSLFDDKITKAGHKATMLLIFLAINIIFNILTILISGYGLEMYRCSYGIPPLTVISAFAGILSTVVLSQMATSRPVLYIGKNSLIFFMWHQAVVYPLMDQLYHALGIDGYGSNPLEFLIILFTRLILVCLIMWGLTELVRHTPLRIFVGK
ncbi:MAG: acyltransferase family protein [Lachnospiraceae bacterium]|nr:acyltransferase family protein [Lachnospiraceae bacterium]